MLNHTASPQYQKYVEKMKAKGKAPKSRKDWEKAIGLTGPVNQPKFTKNWKPAVKDVMEKHDLTDDDADEVKSFKKKKPSTGKEVPPAELMRRFLEHAKPETKERMKGMSPAEFMKMLAAISDEEEGGGGKAASLRDSLIKLAHEEPEMRKHLLPLLNKQAHGPVSLKDPDVMLYYIDPGANSSKFYEMKVTMTSGGYLLQKRWGRLTDKGGVSGRVDSKDETYPTFQAASRAMNTHAASKRAKGYKDAPHDEYPIGLGAAGFGWGGQAACAYTPELNGLLGLSGDIDDRLSSFKGLVQKLHSRGSGMVDRLENLVLQMEVANEELSKYLRQQLSACR